jgi:hypothetical protein
MNVDLCLQANEGVDAELQEEGQDAFGFFIIHACWVSASYDLPWYHPITPRGGACGYITAGAAAGAVSSHNTTSVKSAAMVCKHTKLQFCNRKSFHCFF